ncbi:hypothetical protein CROQUDRAFT_689445 [Cronartium quercuum f. sp. fusiforme G11]|uniref:Cytochrome P450 n=1 Tax=Cronartium quercuum f. sp. fusiforme G11 TaxID=708437 RepID=A0A9P6NRZ6_9BASI|nr:hypothetical protein CROQUDRAFT_689445 [Cronartium quercuum f. sp. fusiforme G11]
MSEYWKYTQEAVLLLITIKLVTLVFKYRKRAIGTSERKDIYPEIPAWPLLGSLPEVVWNCTNLLEWAAQLERIYGPGVSLTLPRLRLIEISRPDWIEHVQKTNFQNYVKGSFFHEVMSDVFGQGIFVVDGPAWRSTRQTTTRLFNAQNFQAIVTPAMHQTLRSFNDLLSVKAKEGVIVELDDLFHRFTLDSFLKMTFGRDSGGLNLVNTGENSDPFAKAFDFVQKQMDLRFTFSAGSLFLGRILGKRPKTIAARQTLDQYVYDLIDDRSKADMRTKTSHDLLGLFMSFCDEKGAPLSRTELKDSALNLIIAGRDTTAQALSWTFFHLIKNPELLEPMREEIEGLLPTDEDLVDYNNYKQFKNVLAVFYEALRLHPSVPKVRPRNYLHLLTLINSLRNAKFAVKHDKLPDGPLIEPNDCLRWSDWQMARNPNIWGPDCEEFKPSRWIDEDGKLKQYSQWTFHAFNGGPRICIGMHLATLEAVAAIVEIVRRYDLVFSPGWLQSVPKIRKITPQSKEQTPRYGSSLTLPMAQPMKVILTRRGQGQNS